jgi:hypothetical protein
MTDDKHCDARPQGALRDNCREHAAAFVIALLQHHEGCPSYDLAVFLLEQANLDPQQFLQDAMEGLFDV